jgi:hypothetical protein
MTSQNELTAKDNTSQNGINLQLRTKRVFHHPKQTIQRSSAFFQRPKNLSAL